MPRIPAGYRVAFFDDALRRGVEGVLEHYRSMVRLALRGDCRVLVVEEPVRIVTLFRGRRLARIAGAMSFAHNCGELGWPVVEDAWARCSEPVPGYSPGGDVWREVEELGIPPTGGCIIVRSGDLPRGPCTIAEIRGPGTRVLEGTLSSEDPTSPVVQGLVGARARVSVADVAVPSLWVSLLSVEGSPLLVWDPRSRAYAILGEILDPELSRLLRYNLAVNVCRRDVCGREHGGV